MVAYGAIVAQAPAVCLVLAVSPLKVLPDILAIAMRLGVRNDCGESWIPSGVRRSEQIEAGRGESASRI